MALGFFLALWIVSRGPGRSDGLLLEAIYFIVLQFLIVTAVSLLFSSFSSPLLSAVLAFAIFLIGSFAEDLRGFAAMAHGVERPLATAAAYLVPDFAALNVISQAAHDQPLPASLALYNTLYALFYVGAALSGAILIFERRDLK